ncbi:MAG TPA: hypothetical protein VK150_02355, partial [Geothrix sp.]|nr:hypothetical protein [Geothrix sp.]
MRGLRLIVPLLAVTAAYAQLPQGLDLQALKQAAAAQGVGAAVADAVPSKGPTAIQTSPSVEDTLRTRSEDEKLDEEIRAMKRREKGPT